MARINLNQCLPMGIKMYQYPINIPKETKKISIKAVNISQEKLEYSTIADLIFDENQPVGKSTNYILTLQVDESTNVWSFNILDSNKTRVFFKHYEAKFDNSSKLADI